MASDSLGSGLIFIALGMLLFASTAFAATIYVNTTGYALENGSYYENSTPIQAAINYAGAGDTLSLAAGIYNKSVLVDKSISMIGAGAGSTFIDGTGIAGATLPVFAGSLRALVSVNPPNAAGAPYYVRIEGITIENSQRYGLGVNGNSKGTVRFEAVDCIFSGSTNDNLFMNDVDATAAAPSLISGNTFNGPSGSYLDGSDYIQVRNNSFVNAGVGSDQGLGFQQGTNIVVDSNVFDGWANSGLYVSATTTQPLNSNVVSNNTFRNSGTGDPGLGYGMLLTQQANAAGYGTLQIENNSIFNNTQGIVVTPGAFASGDSSQIGIKYNKLETNSGADVNNGGSGALNATYNWWGHPAGPYNAASNPGGVDGIVSDGVSFQPYYVGPLFTSISADNQILLNTTLALNSTQMEVLVASGNGAAEIAVPENITNATLNLAALLQESGGSRTAKISGAITICINASFGNVCLMLPENLTVTGSSSWDGIVPLPVIVPASSVSVTADAGKSATAFSAARVELGNGSLSYDKGLRLNFSSQSGKDSGYYAGAFTKISGVCADDSQATGDALAASSECAISSGTDLIIWLKHITTFVTYDQVALNTGGGGSSCSSRCDEGDEERKCASGTSFTRKTCGNYDTDSCYEWSGWNETNCGRDEVCQAGQCVAVAPACTDECAVGGEGRGCEGISNARTRTCGDYDGDSCLEWGEWNSNACAGNEECSSGICVHKCTESWSCGEWSSCAINEFVYAISGNEKIFGGTRERACADGNGCAAQRKETQACNVTVKLEKTPELEVVLDDSRTNALVRSAPAAGLINTLSETVAKNSVLVIVALLAFAVAAVLAGIAVVSAIFERRKGL